MATEYYIPTPPPEVFASKGDDPVLNIIRENRTQFVIDRITYDQGILVWYKDTPYPRRGFPTPESVSAVNVVKHVFIEAVKSARMWPIAAAVVASSLMRFGRRKVTGDPSVVDYGEAYSSGLEKMLASFNRICLGLVSKHVLKPEFMTPLASELQGLLFAFLHRCGISRDTARAFATVMGACLEYDNAYRYRLEDIFTETDKARLAANPRREIGRLVRLYCSREKDWGVAMKFKTVWRLASPLFLLPRVKDALRGALRGCEFERLQLDDIDRYWCSVRLDYDFFGRPYSERMRGHVPVQGYRLQV